MAKDIMSQYGKPLPEERAESEGRQLRVRSGLLIVLFLAALGGYIYILYGLQIIQGNTYREEAEHTVVRLETVDSVRGDILDFYGRPLVTNTQSYQITLNAGVMGDRELEIITELLELCREEGVTWADSFPVSASPPYAFTKGDVYTYRYTRTDTDDWGIETVTTETRRTNLGALAVKCGWIDDPLAETPKAGAVTYRTAPDLMARMCEYYGIELPEAAEGELPNIPARTRQLLGVLYELSLRERDVVYTDYVFSTDPVGITFISKVKEWNLTGVDVSSKASRQINTTYAAHVLGRVGAIDADEMDSYLEKGYPRNAWVGKQGAEKAFESYLHGVSGVRAIETSLTGKFISQEWETDTETGKVKEPVPGGNVVLTMDINFQAMVEDALAAHVQSLPEPKGAAVAIVNMTGGALALASYPTYDLATYGENVAELGADPLHPLVNRATAGTYSPGSTFKPLTAVAGLMEGIITPRDRIVCRGVYTYEGWRNFAAYCHWRSGHGTEDLVKALKDSCNCYFYDVGRRVGITKLDEYAARFGLGQRTGIEIGDEAGYVAGPATSDHFGQHWNEGATVYAAIGQENNQITPLQLANYIATLVNGGNHYAVHLLDSVKSHDYGAVLYEYQPELLNTIDIPESDLAAIKQGMYQVTQNAAIARYFNNLPVKAGAKTGTAELTAGYDNKNTNGLLVVFAPLEEPEIAMCILMEGGTSGSSLASLAYDILDYYFSHEAVLAAVPTENTLIR